MNLSDGAKYRISLGFLSTVLGVVGMWLLFPALGWRGLLGIFLALWGVGIANDLANKRFQRAMEMEAKVAMQLKTIEENFKILDKNTEKLNAAKVVR